MSSLRIIVLGAAGQFGTDLVEVLGHDGGFDVIALSHTDCDCTNENKVAQVIGSLHPETVINCAAYVRVDDCEEHASEAFDVNAIGALNVARACTVANALCAYISTDYVFDGTKPTPYTESDRPNPINIYGASKLAGEYLTRQAALRWLIVRTASLFGKTGARSKGGNFVETIIKKARSREPIKVVNDITTSPTYSRDAANGLVALLHNRATGLFHIANEGTCSWYAFAKTISELAELGSVIDPVPSSQFFLRARRPKNSALLTEGRGLQLRSWKDALQAYLVEKGHLR
jgi:dTDP-4-dehydrorhamnose reductase